MLFFLLATAGAIVLFHKSGPFKVSPLPVPLAILSPFGERIHPVKKIREGHNGIDLRAPEGTPLLAPNDGIITFRNFHEAGGLQMGMRTDDGDQIGFAHLSVQNANVGQRVIAGEMIGRTGSTGKVTGPHLHLTLTLHGATEKTDPKPFLLALMGQNRNV